MNKNILISTAMLSAYWDRHRKDIVDLLIPFIEYSIAKTTGINECVDITKLSDYMNIEFGYETLPTNTIKLLLKRMSPKTLKKNDGRYYLKRSLDARVQDFEKGHIQFEERREKVAVKLVEYLNIYSPLKNKWSQDRAIQALIDFFAVNGMIVMSDTAMIELLKKKDDPIQYHIAQFMLDEFKNDSAIFGYIVDMVKGFFVSTVISLQPTNSSVSTAKFKNLQCYVDTSVIINALGLGLDSEEKAACELLEMLTKKGAKLYCFEHTYREIDDIISAYKYGIQSPHKRNSHQTLARWDEQNYTVTDVERYQSILRSKLELKGFTIINSPQMDIKKYPFNDTDLEGTIKEKIKYSNRDALKNDVCSIASILMLRDGYVCGEIEKSRFIFVTSNTNLCNAVNSFLTENSICDRRNVMPIITDIELASIVWLKCYATHKDYPKQKLIENAFVALEPTTEMINAFFEIVDRIKADGGITEDEAAIIKTDLFCRKILATEAEGDVQKINDGTVKHIKEKLRMQYVEEANGKAELNYKKYLAERDENRKNITNAIREIRKAGEEKSKKIYENLKHLSWVVIILTFVAFVVASIFDLKDDSYSWWAIILLIFSILGLVDMMCSKMQYIYKWIHVIARKKSDEVMDKKKTEYENIIGKIEM